MFEIKEEKFGSFNKISLINSKTKEQISIIPEFGGNTNEIILNHKGKNISVLDRDLSYKELTENKWYKGAKLIPFPNRINDGKYSFNGSKYCLPVNFPAQGHAIHGLLYNKKFKIKNKTSNPSSASVLLEYKYNNEFSGYPFNFIVNIKHSISKDGYICETIVKNSGKEEFPFGDGWHPYFKLGNKVNNLLLKIPQSKKIIVNDRMIPTGNKVKYSKFQKRRKINSQKFDTGFKIDFKGKKVQTELFNPQNNIKLIIWQETGHKKYNYLQVFIPPARESIAIEPMTCNTNAFNSHDGIIILKPKEVFKASYGVKIS